MLLALAGAAIVLWPAGGGWPVPRSLADALGIIGGFSFALNNVMLRREAHQPEMARSLAMFVGGAWWPAAWRWPSAARASCRARRHSRCRWVLTALALGLIFLVGNLALQYGAARLRANATAVVMITEVLFASVSALALGAGQLSAPLLVGGALILGAALLASLRP